MERIKSMEIGEMFELLKKWDKLAEKSVKTEHPRVFYRGNTRFEFAKKVAENFKDFTVIIDEGICENLWIVNGKVDKKKKQIHLRFWQSTGITDQEVTIEDMKQKLRDLGGHNPHSTISG